MSTVREIRFTMGNEYPPKSKKPAPRIPLGKTRRSSTPFSTRMPPNFGTEPQEVHDDYSNDQDKAPRDGPYTQARRSRILLYIALIWLGVLTITNIIMMWRRSDPLPVVLEEIKDPSKWHIPFNLIPDEGSNGRIMTLGVDQINFDKLLRYDVCCKQGPYFVCRAVSKNVGIECYLTNASKAVVHIKHPDMVGAKCTLMWTELRY